MNVTNAKLFPLFLSNVFMNRKGGGKAGASSGGGAKFQYLVRKCTNRKILLEVLHSNTFPFKL